MTEKFSRPTWTRAGSRIRISARTQRELRLSNYLLWQLAYSELYVTECLWPDFNKEELLNAIRQYDKRERRFGGVTAVKTE